jgi:NADPH:quinone reductase-like Zn-dependent oxidoreductase
MIEAVKTLTNGRGVDITPDTVGDDRFEPTPKMLRLGSRQIAVASPRKRRVKFGLMDFYHNAATPHGVDSSGFSGERFAAIQQPLRAMFKEGALQAPDVAQLAFDRAVEPYEAVQRGAAARQC